jgi:hypothetical protein
LSQDREKKYLRKKRLNNRGVEKGNQLWEEKTIR